MTAIASAEPAFDGEAATTDPTDRGLPSLARRLALRWTGVAQVGVALLAAAVYLVDLTISGFANTYYSAAALAASKSWSAWFFGSIDAANFITIDKPTLSTMVMGLSVRLFGLSPASILVPEALMGVATVVVLMAIVRRTMGSPAAVVAGLVAALTPAAVLMFRYNNPDALLTLLLVGSAYALLRAVEGGRLRWVVLAALLVGLAFNTKFLQAWLVLPGYALVWAIAAPGSVAHRVRGLAVAFATVVLASGWWVAVMELLPASARPFVGGSTTGSALELLLGYDGLGRILGAGAPGGGAGPTGGPGGGFSGSPGLLRLFNSELGGQVAWFLPLAFLGLAVGLWARRRAPRTDLRRAAYLAWGSWLLVHAVVFSFMSGIIHSYYAVAMAPAIGALVGGGVTELWSLRGRTPRRPWPSVVLAVGLMATAGVSWLILGRTPDFAPGLAIAVVAVTAAVALVIVVPVGATIRRLQVGVIAVGLVALLAGPGAYAAATIGTAYGGGDPQAGPLVATTDGRAGFGPGLGATGRSGAFGSAPGGTSGLPLGAAPGGGPLIGAGGAGGAGGAAGGPGRFGDQALGTSVTDYLLANRGGARWIVAVRSANQAATIELATGEPVMAMGGFSGSDPAPTLAGLQAFVASGELRFVIVAGGGGPDGGSTTVTDWVQASCTAVSAVSPTLYDCAGALAGT